MKKLTIPFISVVFALLFILSCEKDETNSSNPNQNEELVYTEEAFPNSTGNTVTVEFNGEMLSCELIDGVYVYQGDIIIEPSTEKATKGAGIESSGTRWPYGVVYYEINDNLPDTDRITDAIAHWESKTDIVLEERSDEEDYVEFVYGSGCSSYLGMKGGKQEIRIADWGTTGNVIHEIGHALGLIHEHSKKNRDDHIIIVWDNIESKYKNNFSIYQKSVITEDFDFGSIMLYPSYAFSTNDEATITKPDGSTFKAQRDALSEKDVEIISEMYSELHDPVYEFGFADMPGNAHITSDGTYLYSVGDGYIYVGRINKFDLEGKLLHTYNMPEIKGRGLSYNEADGFLYASVYGGHIIRITDLENGIIDTIYHGIMQNPEASFALSEDGKKMYDFNDGTVKVYNFETGDLMSTMVGLYCGTGYYDGGAAIAVDISYMYTWDANTPTIYVYNHIGDWQRSMNIGRGNVGISLSVFDGYLCVADDPYYDPGFWLCYNIRNPVKEE